VPRVTGPDWPSFYAGSSPADCHRLDQLVRSTRDLLNVIAALRSIMQEVARRKAKKQEAHRAA
jgi:hypothetical protein